MAAAATKAGHAVQQRKLDTPLRIQGVGNGTNKGDWEVRTPIAVPVLDENDEQVTELFDFECPAIEGNGEDLPLILGLKSMSEKRGVLEMDKDKRMLTFPGPGGYTINWAPGAVRIPLQDAMSKHAMIPCARFDQVASKSQQGGLPAKKMTFHATAQDAQTTGDEVQPQSQSNGSSSSGLLPEERSSVPVHPTH